MFEDFLLDLSILELGFGFLRTNYVYSRLETSGNPKFGQNITEFIFDKNNYRISGLDPLKGQNSYMGAI